ncbi:MAG TPA: DUF1326 domain-containing protein [Thermoplasmata archaeon]|jgi:hypothetical protein|nr:DUF1326 domain-containing protein [Thermoplasmata archaeon]
MEKQKKWSVKVEQLMSCSCNWGCPCSFNAPPTYGKCEAALGYRAVRGTYGGVALDGLKWVLVAAWPAAIHLGNGRGLVYLDERAKGEKREALEALSTSKKGPLAVYMNSMTRPPEVRTARIEFKFAGKKSGFAVGKPVRVEFEPMRNPVTGDEHMFTGKLPTGLFTKSEDFYSAKTFRVDADGFNFDYPGRNAILSTANWRGP